ncbi:hypothetical protein [Streptomyces anulatus]|uniref:hypothetical protein n=1 Tax=Streptomyces anulatus TaxID=1892 RepID=UPI0034349215
MRAAARAAGLGAGLPITAAPGIARSIIRFVENVIPGLDHHATLRAMHDEHLVLTHAMHSAPGGHH